MSNTEHFSVSVDKDRAARLRSLVEQGTFPSMSSAFDAAADALLALEEAKAGWWQETARRCDEAEKHPERMIDADTFFESVREEIARTKGAHPGT